MESFFSRYRNPMVLGLVLLLQVFGLAVQVKRPVDPRHPDYGSVRLIRLWTVGAITPLEKILLSSGAALRQGWHDYVNVIGLRQENRVLRAENERLRLDQARLSEDAEQARRLQALLDFKSRFIAGTVAAQIVGSSGSEQSRVVYIDKGYGQGLQLGMAVITSEGVVGKVRDVFRSSAQVLLINDSTSGVGALLENSRLQGVVKGTPAGDLMLDHIMSDEKVEVGERVLTSGGDRIYPKGLLVGTVAHAAPGNDLFWNIRIRPAANLNRLEEVLVVTEIRGEMFQSDESGAGTTADILAQRLPGIHQNQPKPKESKASDQGTGGAASPVNPAPAARKLVAPQTSPRAGGTPPAKPHPALSHPPAAAPAAGIAARPGKTPATAAISNGNRAAPAVPTTAPTTAPSASPQTPPPAAAGAATQTPPAEAKKPEVKPEPNPAGPPQ